MFWYERSDRKLSDRKYKLTYGPTLGFFSNVKFISVGHQGSCNFIKTTKLYITLSESSAKHEPLDVLQPFTHFVLGPCNFFSAIVPEGSGWRGWIGLGCDPILMLLGVGFETLIPDVGSTALRLQVSTHTPACPSCPPADWGKLRDAGKLMKMRDSSLLWNLCNESVWWEVHTVFVYTPVFPYFSQFFFYQRTGFAWCIITQKSSVAGETFPGIMLLAVQVLALKWPAMWEGLNFFFFFK